jgi:CubicO group peptidase (beta-lactamase class C family)
MAMRASKETLHKANCYCLRSPPCFASPFGILLRGRYGCHRMNTLATTPHPHDFSAAHTVLRNHIDKSLLVGATCAVLRGRALLDVHSLGHADREAELPMAPDHIFRAFSNSKLMTSIAVLLLWEDGLLDLDEPVDRFVPQLGNRRVIKPGSTSLSDTEAARSPITVRQLLTHSSGLDYGLLDPETPTFQAYKIKAVLHPLQTLNDMMDKLADLPLLYHPGEGWQYSVATDVLGRVVEVASGMPFGDFLRQRIFQPLGMVDTGFAVPTADHGRLAAFYVGADLNNPFKPGLTRKDNYPYPGAYLHEAPWQSGGGGLVSTLPDMIALMRGLMPPTDAHPQASLLKPETLALMMRNQLPDGRWIRFPRFGDVVGKGFGLGGAVTLQPSPFDPAGSTGEFQWGGLAGTHWWIHPGSGLAGLVMTQRHMAFWHPFFFAWKHAIYQAAGV